MEPVLQKSHGKERNDKSSGIEWHLLRTGSTEFKKCLIPWNPPCERATEKRKSLDPVAFFQTVIFYIINEMPLM